MDRLDGMRIFAAVAERQSFADAARRLALSPPAVTRAVAALEERIGVRLLQRTTRAVRLTDAGSRYLADCRRILAELAEAEAAAAGARVTPQGSVGVTAPAMFGRRHVAPVLIDFLARHPAVMVRTLLVDRVVDMIEEGIDIAVRIAHLPDSTAQATRVGAIRRVVCAAPRFLRKHGTPKQPADLAGLPVIGFAGPIAATEWVFRTGRGPAVSTTPRLMVNTAEVAVAAAAAGHGLTSVLFYQAAREVKAGRLKIVLAEFEPPPIPVHVIHREGRRASAAVRALVDHAVERLRADPVVNGRAAR